GVCTVPTCPPGTPQGAEPYPSCKCPTGTEDVGGVCTVPTCPPGTPQGAEPYPSCKCPSGQTEVNGVCTEPTCPDGTPDGAQPYPNCQCLETEEIINNTCTEKCPLGYKRNDIGRCIPLIGDPVANPNPDSVANSSAFKYGGFLKSINAHYAHARGYTGFIVDRNWIQTATQSGVTPTISDKRVRVGILDGGTDYDHPILAGRIVAQHNFDYGPCRNGDTTNCYGWKYVGIATTGERAGNFVFYKEDSSYEILLGEDEHGEKVYYTQEQIDDIFKYYPADYDWDDLENDANPHEIPDDTEYQGNFIYTNMLSKDHGTHVAGIVAGNGEREQTGMNGVAKDAELVIGHYEPNRSYRETNKSVLSSYMMQTFADDKIRVLNLSICPKYEAEAENQASYLLNHNITERFTTDDIEAYKIAARNDIVLVFAAGNANQEQPSILGGVLLSDELNGTNDKDADLTNLLITTVSAVSTDDGQTWQKASYSNKCGASKDWCLAAPGGDYKTFKNDGEAKGLNGDELSEYTLSGLIYSAVKKDDKHVSDYGYMDGTSQAAPVVTGSVAVLMGAYPYLSSQDIVAILFETATDIGAPGTDDVFGRGLVDLKKATEPVGDLWLPTQYRTTAGGASVASSRVTLPLALTSSALKNMPQSIMMLDKYARPFAMSTNSLIRKEEHQKQNFADTLKAFTHRKKKLQKPSENFSFAFSEPITNQSDLSAGFMEMNYTTETGNAFSFAFSEETALHQKNFFEKSMQNPFLQMRNAYTLNGDFKLTDTLSFETGLTYGESAFIKDRDMASSLEDDASLMNIGISYKMADSLTFNMSAGMLNEEESLLGLSGNGAFDVNGSRTEFVSAGLKWQATENLCFGASYTQGFTKADKTGSLLSFTDLKSDSMAFDVSYDLDKERTIGFSALSPLKITNGSALLRLPIARDGHSDTVYYDTIKSNLNEGSREWDLDVFYTHLVGDVLLQAQTGLRLNPEHNADNSTDYRAMISASFDF
ncbi:MAG: S8 family serine peptidase, partial [Alphaproteobacteria bacterium]|nr:S8 family serine peptidase [Alphaproteobacteria bacterium]